MRLPRYLTTLLLSTLLMGSLPSLASAGEIRILDSRGLVRAVRTVESPMKVVVETRSAGNNKKATLINSDGIGHDIKGVEEGVSSITFPQVSEGTWQIQDPPSSEVKTVKILG